MLKLPGYYYKGEKIPRTEETELKIGIDFNFIKKALEEVDTSSLDFPILDPDTIEKLVYTTYGNNTVTMYIPVAEEDVIFQLYWYGLDIYYDSEGIHFDNSLTHHNPGTHPTSADVEEINKTYGTQHTELGDLIGVDLSTYRDYYTLAMGLIKQ